MKLIRDCFWFATCWLALRVYLLLPGPLSGSRFGFAILPYAGMYAHSDSWADFRETVQWNADGRPSHD